MMLGHSGYLETVRRALHYTLRHNSIDAAPDTVEAFMRGWQHLSPFPEVLSALARLQSRYQLVVLSNGDPAFLQYLVAERVAWEFDDRLGTAGGGKMDMSTFPPLGYGQGGDISLPWCRASDARKADMSTFRAPVSFQCALLPHQHLSG